MNMHDLAAKNRLVCCERVSTSVESTGACAGNRFTASADSTAAGLNELTLLSADCPKGGNLSTKCVRFSVLNVSQLSTCSFCFFAVGVLWVF